MMRASSLHRSPLLLLAAVLIASTVFLVHNSRPASADHEDPVTIWSATYTAPNLLTGFFVGCVDNTLECAPHFTKNTFSYAGTTYRIGNAQLRLSDRQFSFGIGKDAHTVMPDEFNAFSLIVDGKVFPLATGQVSGWHNTGDSRVWPNSGLNWAAGDMIEMSLVGPPPHPTVSISASPATVDEGSPVTITLTLSWAASRSLTIPLVIYDFNSEPNDYGRLASITIPANSITGTGIITTRHDAGIRDEVFGVNLGEMPRGVVAGTVSSVAITIVDDDYPETLSDLPSLPIDYSRQRPARERTPTGAGAGGAYCYVGAGNGTTEYIRYPDGRVAETTRADPVIRSMFACD